MRTKVNQLLIIFLLLILLSLGSYALSAGQAANSLNYLPFISLERSGWLGPYGGYLVAIAADPLDPQTIYAGSWGAGIFKSTDNGLTWQVVNNGLDNLYINSLAIDPNTPNTVYAGTYRSQLYKSLDGGNTWFWSSVGIQEQAVVYTIAIDPLMPSTIYIGTRGVSNDGNPPWSGVAYKSVDAGATWTPMLTDVGGTDVQDWVYSIAVNPSSNYELFAATHEHGPYRSGDYGATWYSSHDGISDDSGRAIVIEPQSPYPTTLYYGVWHYDGVYKSINSGNDWIITNAGILDTKVYGMAIDPEHRSTVYLATFNHGLLRTLDGGETWVPVGLWNELIYTVAINPTSVANLFAGTAGNGLFRSLDGGDSWQSSNNGIDNSMITSVIISPSNPNQLYTSLYGAGVMQSHDAGQTWSELNTGLNDKYVHVLLMSPANPQLLSALTDTGGLYQNDLSGGSGWVLVGDGLPLTIHPTPAYAMDHPFASHEMQESFATASETQEISQPTVENLMAMAYALSAPNIAYLGTGGSGVYKSTNGGLSWQPAGLTGEYIWSVAVDPADPDLVYAATSTPGSLKVSQDGGATWTDANLQVTFYSIATSPASPGLLVAGTDSGLFRYQAGSWTQMGLSDQVVNAIAIDPHNSSVIYAGTTNGAYYTIDGGTTWFTGPLELNGIIIQSISLDPSQPHLVYFGTKTHGIFLATIR